MAVCIVQYRREKDPKPRGSWLGSQGRLPRGEGGEDPLDWLHPLMITCFSFLQKGGPAMAMLKQALLVEGAGWRNRA